MAKTPPRKQIKKRTFVPEAELPQSMNYTIIIAGIVTVLIGYVLMSMGDAVSALSVDIAPVVLVLGYCIIIPIGIIYRKKAADSQPSA
jgi:hypothetical protein